MLDSGRFIAPLFATAGVVANAGATPIFADIAPKTYNISVGSVAKILRGESLFTGRLPGVTIKAITPVHLYGQPADMEEIMALAKEYGLYVVEDVAQAIGAEYKGHRVGTFGHLGCLSFFPTENLGAYGDGRMVVTDDGELAEKVRMLRVHGSKPKYYHHLVGTNSRLDALQAAILRAKLPHLSKQGIATEVYYPLPLHFQLCFRHLGYREGELPESERASREVLSLLMFPELTEEELEYAASEIRRFLEMGKGGPR